jgi:hypothetical protein
MADQKLDLYGGLENLVVQSETTLPSREVTVTFNHEQIGNISFKCLVNHDSTVSLGENQFNVSFFVECLTSGNTVRIDLALKFYQIFLHKSINGGFPERAILNVVGSILKDTHLESIGLEDDCSKIRAGACAKIVNNLIQFGII